MITERLLPLQHLPAKLIRSVINDALADNQPVPTSIIAGFCNKVIRYYRAVDPFYLFPY